MLTVPRSKSKCRSIVRTLQVQSRVSIGGQHSLLCGTHGFTNNTPLYMTELHTDTYIRTLIHGDHPALIRHSPLYIKADSPAPDTFFSPPFCGLCSRADNPSETQSRQWAICHRPQRHHTDSIFPWTVSIRAWVDRSQLIALYSVSEDPMAAMPVTDKTLALLFRTLSHTVSLDRPPYKPVINDTYRTDNHIVGQQKKRRRKRASQSRLSV